MADFEADEHRDERLARFPSTVALAIACAMVVVVACGPSVGPVEVSGEFSAESAIECPPIPDDVEIEFSSLDTKIATAGAWLTLQADSLSDPDLRVTKHDGRWEFPEALMVGLQWRPVPEFEPDWEREWETATVTPHVARESVKAALDGQDVTFVFPAVTGKTDTAIAVSNDGRSTVIGSCLISETWHPFEEWLIEEGRIEDGSDLVQWHATWFRCIH